MFVDLNTMICDIIGMRQIPDHPEMMHRHQAFFPNTHGDRVCSRIADEIWGTRTNIRRSQYDRSFLALVLSGSAQIRCGEEHRQVRAGQVWGMLAKGDYHIQVTETMHILIMTGTGKIFNQACKKISSSDLAIWDPARPQVIETLITEALQVADEGGPKAEAIAINSFQLIIDLLAHAPQRQSGSRAAQTFAACSDVINRQALTLNSISDAAIECGIDRAYLSRLFKQYTGESAAQYLCRCKMQHAAQELASGSTVADTASACGYTSADVFTRVFNRFYGLTPRKWLQQLE